MADEMMFVAKGDTPVVNKLSGIPMVAIASLIAPLEAIAQPQSQPAAPPEGYYWHGPWLMWRHGYGWPFAWWICPLIVLCILVVVAAIFFFARRARGAGGHHGGRPSCAWSNSSQSALQILNERFARGEIQKDEYMQRKLAILSGGPQ